jgi:hypothetical protein
MGKKVSTSNKREAKLMSFFKNIPAKSALKNLMKNSWREVSGSSSS